MLNWLAYEYLACLNDENGKNQIKNFYLFIEM